MATSVRSAAALRRLAPSMAPARTGCRPGMARFGARTGPRDARVLSMVTVDSTRCRAKKAGDGDGATVPGVPLVGGGDQLSVVMKFGGSSVSSAARMEEVAGLIRAFPEERPVVVLSAMGKTTNLLLLVLLLIGSV